MGIPPSVGGACSTVLYAVQVYVSDWKLAIGALEQGYINECILCHYHGMRSAIILVCLFVAIETGGRGCG